MNWSELVIQLLDWPATSQARAVENARGSAVACSRGRVEREEVAAYLLARATATRREDPGVRHSG